MLSVMSITETRALAGRPLVAISNLRLPHRAGVKFSVWDWIGFIISTIPYIPAFIASRPAVVDKRVTEVIFLTLQAINISDDN